MNGQPTRRTRILAVALVAATVGVLVACSSSSTSEDARDIPEPVADERVVALGEEFLLADLLALGVRPVASTATQADAGFQGIDATTTTGIAALSSTEPNLELLASLAPDRIVATQFVVDEVGRDTLEGTGAALVVLPNGLDAEAQVLALGDAFDRRAEAEQLAARLDAARHGSRARVPQNCEVSMATIYPGPSPAAWVGGPSAAVAVVGELGCTLVPGAGTGGSEATGRVRLSHEQLGQLSAPRMVLLQSSAVPGETDALTTIEADPLWHQLPAVRAGAVAKLDRLAYPGLTGRVRLYDDLSRFFAG